MLYFGWILGVALGTMHFVQGYSFISWMGLLWLLRLIVSGVIVYATERSIPSDAIGQRIILMLSFFALTLIIMAGENLRLLPF